MTRTATLHLMVGLPCSGKTMRAKEIEREHAALRLTPDEWLVRLLGADVDEGTLDAAREPIELLLWEVAAKVLAIGGDVILDFGFWSRAERDDFRARAAKLGARCVVHFLDTSEEELFTRLRERNAHLPAGCFRIDETRVRQWLEWFESPDEQELVTSKEIQ